MGSGGAAARVRRVAGHLVVPALAVILAVVTVSPRRGPVVAPDEMGYLAGARAIAGAGNPLDMAGLPMYPIGWPVVAAVPARLFAGDPATTYTATVAVQIALLAATGIVTTRLVRSLLRVHPVEASVASVIGVTIPSVIVTTRFVWSETFVTFWVSVTATGVLALYRRSSSAAATGRRDLAIAASSGLAVGWMPFAHGRLVPGACAVVLVTTAMLVAHRRWSSISWFATGVVAAALLGQGVTTFVRSDVWDDRVRSNLAATWRGVGSAADLWQTVQLAGGHAWAFLIGSFGLAAVAVWVAASAIRPVASSERRTRPVRLLATPERGFAVAGLAVLVGTLFASAAFFTGSVFERGTNRQDHLLYGRYLDVFQPIVVAIGLAVVLHAARRGRARRVAQLGLVAAGSIAAGTLFVEATGRTELASALPFNPFTSLNLARTGADVARAALETSVVLGASMVASISVARYLAGRSSQRLLGWTLAACALPFLAANLVRWHDAADATDGVDYNDARRVVEYLDGADVMAVRFDRSIWLGDRLAIQYWMPDLVAERVSLPVEVECDGATAVVTHAETSAPDLVAGRLAVVRCGEPGTTLVVEPVVETVDGP